MHPLRASGLCLLLAACAGLQPARAVDSAADLARLGLEGDAVAPWEDGRRTDGAPGTWEWWYLDARLDDGSTLVVVFSLKPLSEVQGPLRPSVRVDWDRADGGTLTRTFEVPAEQLEAATSGCDVRLGPHRFQGDLRTYRVVVEGPDLALDLTLTSGSTPWRPGAGAIAFGAADEATFHWLPSVPQGRVQGTLRTPAGATTLEGSGYHDHNWGNAALQTLVHDWYWGRAQVGPYSLITSFITAESRYGFRTFPIFYLARGRELLAGDARRVAFRAGPATTDEVTGKPVSSTLQWEYREGARGYRVTFERRKDLVRTLFTDGLPPFQRFLARLAGIDSAYLRFTGEVAVEVLEGTEVKERHVNDAAVWELMYLGHARTPEASLTPPAR